MPFLRIGFKENCIRKTKEFAGNLYRIDILVDKIVIVELKTVEHIKSIREAQLLTYLKLSDLWLGLLINFNVPVLKEDIYKIVN